MTTPPPPAPTMKIIESYLQPLPRQVQLAIALIQGENVEFIGAERTPQGVRYLDNRQGVFEIGSITKVFTASLLAYAVEKGSLKLETPIQELLPFKLKESQRNGVEITLKHLANHTSGLCHQPPWIGLSALLHGHPREPFRDYTQERLEHFLQHKMKLDFTPGSQYRYSNLGMSLVGYLLARQANRPYDDLLQTEIFQPLGMSSSATQTACLREQMVPGWEKAGRRSPNWDMSALTPAGGIKTSVEDFAKFVLWQFSTRPAIALTQAPTFKIDEGYHVGLGWHILERENGEHWLNHGGGMLGYTANVNLNVNQKRAALVFSNLGNTHQWHSKSFELCRDLLADLEKAG